MWGNGRGGVQVPLRLADLGVKFWDGRQWSGVGFFKLGLGVYITNVTTSPCAPLLVFLLQRTRYRLGC